MEIKINHIAKMEGHTGFMASVIQGDVKSAKLEVQEALIDIAIHLSINSRLVLGFLVTRIPILEMFAAIGFLIFSFDLCRTVNLSFRFVTMP